MKKFILPFLLGTLSTSYSETAVPETISFFTRVAAEKCERHGQWLQCSEEFSNEENTSVVLDDCSFLDGTEFCGGNFRKIKFSYDGIPFSANIFGKKITEISDAPRYTLTVGVGQGESGIGPVDIDFGADGALTDSVKIRGNSFNANDGYVYIPYITIGPVNPNLN